MQGGKDQDDIPDQVPSPQERKPLKRKRSDDKIVELLPSRLQSVIQSVIEEDEDLRHLPPSTRQRISLKLGNSVKQLLKSDTEENIVSLCSQTERLPSPAVDIPVVGTETSHDPVQAVAPNPYLETQTWSYHDPWFFYNAQSVPQELPTSQSFGEFLEPPHIPQHQLSWYGTAVNPSDTPNIDAYMYEPRRPRRLKMHEENHSHAQTL